MKKDVEIWKDIVGYEGSYQASNWGRVKSLKRVDSLGRLWEEKILKLRKDKYGYLRVQLCKNGKHKTFQVHRLVAQAFLNPVAGKDCVNHLNEVKTDNHYLNLEYCDVAYNNNYNDGQKRRAEKLSKPVQGIDPKTGKVVVEFPSASEAGRNGYDQGHVSNCCNGKRKTHHGFIWRYEKTPEQ